MATNKQYLDGLIKSLNEMAASLERVQVSVIRLKSIAGALEALSLEEGLEGRSTQDDEPYYTTRDGCRHSLLQPPRE